ncbi:MAG: hypothetical protein KAU29_02235, partial [Gammaproteobacteria bacterium]|nr:hypothetical protein [Gammaproteobacteria bacterium]
MKLGVVKNTGLKFAAGGTSRMFALLCLLLVLSSATIISTFPNSASAATVDPATFDHLVTGFPLTGEHELIDCESC